MPTWSSLHYHNRHILAAFFISLDTRWSIPRTLTTFGLSRCNNLLRWFEFNGNFQVSRWVLACWLWHSRRNWSRQRSRTWFLGNPPKLVWARKAQDEGETKKFKRRNPVQSREVMSGRRITAQNFHYAALFHVSSSFALRLHLTRLLFLVSGASECFGIIRIHHQ